MATIIGRNPVIEALRAERRAVRRAFIAKGTQRARIEPIVALARERNVPVRFVDRAELDKLAGGGNHQGVVAVTEDRGFESFDGLLDHLADESEALVVLLDHIQDPHNLGAITRTAEGAGATAVVVPKRGAAPVTAAVAKASAGATAHMPMIRVANVAQSVERFKETGAWVIGATGPEDERTIPYDEYEYPTKVVIVIGHEGDGLSRLVAERCDALVHIPMFGQVTSLNASVAAGILFYEILRQRKGR